MSVYFKLLQFENDGLLAFWDCGLAHYKKDKPSLEQIEEALEEKIEQDSDKAFSEAFTVLDESGFFKKKVNTIWKEFTKTEKPKKDETAEQKDEERSRRRWRRKC